MRPGPGEQASRPSLQEDPTWRLTRQETTERSLLSSVPDKTVMTRSFQSPGKPSLEVLNFMFSSVALGTHTSTHVPIVAGSQKKKKGPHLLSRPLAMKNKTKQGGLLP